MSNLKWQLLKGDCLDVMKSLPENKIDLVFTSPPYEELRKYHNSENLFGDAYVDFITNVGEEIYRILRPGGSFILNIQSQINKKTKQRSLSVHKIVINLVEKVGFSYIEPYIWAKTSATPYKSNLRAYNAFEYCFWFSKGVDNVTFNVDNIRKPYAESTVKRYEYTVNGNFGVNSADGKREYGGNNKRKKVKMHPKGALPSNVIMLPQATGQNKNHPAKMQPKLAEFFIQAGANPGDIVLDPFVGSGTTMIESLLYGCNAVGIELADEYISDTYDLLLEQDNLLTPNSEGIIFDSNYTYKK